MQKASDLIPNQLTPPLITENETTQPPEPLTKNSHNGQKTQLTQCANHGDYDAVLTETLLPGMSRPHVAISECPECEKQRKQRRREESRREREEKKAHRLRISGIPMRYQSKSFENYKPANEQEIEALSLCRHFTDYASEKFQKGSSMIFCGGVGTGKTHLACAIAHELIEYQWDVMYATAVAAITRIKATWERDSKEHESYVIERYSTCDFLILDEIGVQFGTDAEKLLLYRVMNARYENMRPTIMASNLEYDELADAVGERVVDRMREDGGVVISFDWDSYRQN